MLDKIINELLYLPLDIPNPPTHELHDLIELRTDDFYYCNYRTCWLMPIYADVKNDNNFVWMPATVSCPELKEWFINHILPITGDTRIMIIVTPPGDYNSPHIDCSEEMFPTLQHKLRYVMQGNIDDLLFIHDDLQRTPPNPIDKPFVMSGKWPHEMLNTHELTKYTIAIGAPWEADINDNKYRELIQRSYEKYKDYYLSSENMNLVDDWETLFERSGMSPRQKTQKFFKEHERMSKLVFDQIQEHNPDKL